MLTKFTFFSNKENIGCLVWISTVVTIQDYFHSGCFLLIKMAVRFHVHVLLSLCSSKTKPNQSNNFKSLKSKGWWNNSNSSCLSCVSLLQSVTATAAGIGHSRTPRLHAQTKEYAFSRALQWGIQTLQCLEERILICPWRLPSSPAPRTVILCMQSWLLLSVKMSGVT